MCGIAGYIARKGTGVDGALLGHITDLVAHRGPDDRGTEIHGGVGLGHRRLSILDLSEAGRQPLVRDDLGCSLTYNGEVYNYLELREELRSLGVSFSTETDSEVVLAAYAAWGDACVDRFNGMWAFAIHDRVRRRVFCSRDPFGIKPFYYADLGHALVFGSEIRQILPALGYASANMPVVREFLFSTVTEPPEDTFFEGVRKLPGGHNLVVDLDQDSCSFRRYFSLRRVPESADVDAEAAAELIGDGLVDSVRLRLRSDVRVGTCLSGGLDSSSVATIASELLASAGEQRFAAITAVSEDVERDESSYAEAIVDRHGLEWLTVRPSYEVFAQTVSEVVRAQEEPFQSCSIVMQFHVMAAARRNGITVLLDGQGGDETLLGYQRYFVMYLLETLRSRGIRRALAAAREISRSNAGLGMVSIVKLLLYFSSRSLRYAVYRRRSQFLRPAPPFPGGVRANSRGIAEMQAREVMQDNLPALLRYEDKNSMWHGIEARLPFLDPNWLQLALSLPVEAKIHQGWTKYPLRGAMCGRMPDEVCWRRAKFGFEAPDDLWIRQHSADMHSVVGSSSVLAALCDMTFVETRWAHLSNQAKWKLYSVALWEREFGVEPGRL